ncbi:MAG: aspartate--ammonia ligase [Clostridia bacterium]|nr:aspartate--ammonia ligase [Clostridia bacterium]
MKKTVIPAGYASALSLYETQSAIGMLKRAFEDRLSSELNLKRVTAPLFVEPKTGLNDNLSGSEKAVSFDIPSAGVNAEVVHSLAKWKRMALYRYGFPEGKGLYTDMNAIRREETPDNLHSIYVDQWDWEKVMSESDRNFDYLADTVNKIVGAICDTVDVVRAKYPAITTTLERTVKFISSEELLRMFPDKNDKERELEAVRRYGTVFISGIGAPLSNGKPHDSRSPDYDDWDLNGDILFYNELLDCPFEISSMGIRVNAEALDRQLKASGCDARRTLEYHKMLLAGELPQTIGGGVGQSRLSMLILGKAHIGEVQSSIWDAETIESCKGTGIILL